jgi:vitamin B12 transporter
LPLAALLASSIARADELPAIVVSADQIPMEASHVGASVTVLNGDELWAKNTPTVADALRSVPGVEVDQSGGRGAVTSVRIRGSESRQLMVLIDGIEVNQTGFPGFDFADLTTDNIERIEVIRGPASGIHGANADSGLISITTLSGKGLRKGAVNGKVEVGSNGLAAGSVSARGARGPVYGAVSFSDYTTRGYNISRFGSERDGSGAGSASFKGGADITPYLNLESVFRYESRFTDTDPQDFSGGPFTGFIVDGPGRYTYSSVAGRVTPTLTLLDGHWIQSADYKIFQEHTRNYSTSSTADFGADGTRQNLDYKSTYLFDTHIFGGEKHSITGFIDNRQEHYVQLGSSTPYNKKRTGLAGEYVLDLPTSTTLSSAYRHDYNSGFNDADSWRFALSQRFPQWGTRVHSSIGKGITDPDVFALFGSSFNLSNPGLSPEQSIGWDAGVEQSLLHGLAVIDVTYFSTDFTNKIELTFDAARGGFVYVNGDGTATRRGVETSADLALTDWLHVKGSYTYTNAKDSFGTEEIRRPPHSGSAEVTAWFLDHRAQATIGAHFNSTRKDDFFNLFGTQIVNLPGTTILRASLSYDVTKQLTAYVRAENLFDRQYEEIFSYRAPGFMAFAGLKYKLD